MWLGSWLTIDLARRFLVHPGDGHGSRQAIWSGDGTEASQYLI